MKNIIFLSKKTIIQLFIIWFIAIIIHFIFYDKTMNIVVVNQFKNTNYSTSIVSFVRTLWCFYWFIPIIISVYLIVMKIFIKKGIDVK